VFKDDSDLPFERKVHFQELMFIKGTKKEYVVEISYTKTKMIIIVARKRKHYKLEFPKKQGKRLIYDIVGGYYEFAKLVRISPTEALYIENLKDLLNSNGEAIRNRAQSQHSLENS